VAYKAFLWLVRVSVFDEKRWIVGCRSLLATLERLLADGTPFHENKRFGGGQKGDGCQWSFAGAWSPSDCFVKWRE